MANYQLLKADIDAKVYQNGAQEITGENLNSVLNAMVASLGVGYQFMGMATPINPGSAQTPDYKCFYLATTPGTYTNLGGLVVADGEVAILKYDTSWTKVVTGIATAESVSQLGQKVGYPTLRNGSRGNTENPNAVTTEVYPTYGKQYVEVIINRPNTSGYKYVLSVESTDSSDDLGKLVMAAELVGPHRGITGRLDTFIIDMNLTSYPNTKGLMVQIDEVSISDESVSNPLRVGDLDGAVILRANDYYFDYLKERADAPVVVYDENALPFITLVGDGQNYASSINGLSVINGHIYRVFFQQNVDRTGVSSGRILDIKINGSVVFSRNYGDNVPAYADVEINTSVESNVLSIGGRCAVNVQYVAAVQDITMANVNEKSLLLKKTTAVSSWEAGKRIENDLTVSMSVSTWKKSTPIHLLAGQEIFVVTGDTTSGKWKIFETDSSESYYAPIVGTMSTYYDGVVTLHYKAIRDMYVVCQTTNVANENSFMVGYAFVCEYEKPNCIEENGRDLSLQRFLQYSRTVKGGSIENIRKNLVLAHFSDIHQNADNLSHIMQYCQYYGEYIDDVINTGDNVANSFNQTTDADYKTFIENNLAQSVLFCIGNHDTVRYENGSYDWTYYAGASAYTRYIAPYIDNWNVVHDGDASHCYYYKDYSNEKVRLIVIDVMGWNTAQLNWLVDVLSSAITNGLQVVIASHYPADMSVQECTFTSLFAPAFGTSVINEDALSAVDTFISNGGVFVAWLTGHVHRDYIGTITNHPNQLVIAISTASGANGQSQFDNVQRTKGTKSYDLFNIISIDTYNQRLSMFRVGADLDMYQRHIGAICYDYQNKKLIYND